MPSVTWQGVTVDRLVKDGVGVVPRHEYVTWYHK